MNIKREKKPKREFFVLPPALLMVAAVLLAILFSGGVKKKKTVQTAAGLDYIARQAQKDPAEVDRAIRRQENEALRQLAAAGAAQGADPGDAAEKDAVWGMFRDYVILGDSRAVGFTYYHFLDDSRVIADGGNTIRNIADAIDTVKVLNPAYVYLCYGLNDTGMSKYFWKTAEDYGKELDARITDLQAAVPGVTVVVNSILPATEAAMADNPAWQKIPAFSAAAKAVCEKKGIPFVDNDALAAEYMDTLWAEDGVHLLSDFYPLWARNMLSAAMETGTDAAEPNATE